MRTVTSTHLPPVLRNSYTAKHEDGAGRVPDGDATALRAGPFWQKAEFPHEGERL
jgi:hypothetical protein